MKGKGKAKSKSVAIERALRVVQGEGEALFY